MYKKMTSPYWPCHRCEVFAAVLPSSGHFLSAAPRCWSTFIYRTTGLRAVGDFVSQVLQTLVGHTLTSSDSWALLGFPQLFAPALASCGFQGHPPAVPFIYRTLRLRAVGVMGCRSYRLSWVSPFLRVAYPSPVGAFPLGPPATSEGFRPCISIAPTLVAAKPLEDDALSRFVALADWLPPQHAPPLRFGRLSLTSRPLGVAMRWGG